MASKKIGATLALDGEAQFKHAVAGANKELRNMKSSMKLVSEETKGQANTLSTLTQKHEALNNVLTAAKSKQTAVADGLSNARSNYERIGAALHSYQEKLDAAKDKLDEMRSSGTASSDEITNQMIAVSKLDEKVRAASTAYDKAGSAVKDWEGKLSSASTEVVKAQNNLTENDRYLQQAQNSADKCATSIDEFGKKTSESSQKLRNLDETASKIFRTSAVADAFNEGAEAVSNLADKAYEAAKELDEGYDTIIAKTGATGDALTGMTDIANDMYSNMNVSMDTVGSAIGEVNTRFGLQGDALQSLSTQFVQFAELNDTDVSSSIDGVQKTLQAFGQSSSDAGNLLDAFNKVGQNTGISMDTLTSDLVDNAAQFQSMGLSAEDAAGFLGTTEKSGIGVSTMLRGLKTAQKNATSEGKTLNDALADFSDTMQSNASDADKLQAAYDTFGSKAGAAIYNACMTGSISLDDLSGSLTNYAGSVQSTYEATQDPWDKTEEAMHSLQVTGSNLVQTALGSLSPAIEKLSTVAADAAEWFNTWSDSEKAAAASVVLVITGAAKAAPVAASLAQAISAVKLARDASNASAGAETVTLGLHAGAAEADAVATGTATAAQSALNVAMEANPIGALIVAFAAAAAGAAALGYALKDTLQDAAGVTGEMYNSIDAANAASSALSNAAGQLKSSMDSAGDSVASAMAQTSLANDAVADLEALANQSSLTAAEQQQMADDVNTLNGLYPSLGLAIDETTGKLNMSTDALKANIEEMQNSALAAAYQEEYQQVLDNLVDVEKQQIEAQNAQKEAQENYSTVLEQNNAVIEAHNAEVQRQAELEELCSNSATDTAEAEAELQQVTDDLNAGVVRIGDQVYSYTDALNQNEQAQAAAADATSQFNDAQSAASDAEEDAQEQLQGITDTIDDLGLKLPGVTDATNEQSDAMSNAAESNTEYSDSADEVSDAVDTQIQSFAELRQSAIDDLSSASDAFKKYEADSDVSLQSMQEALQSQTQAYNNYADNINTVMGDTRYQTDSNFRAMANSIMQMGMDGADYLQQFTDAVRSGSSDVAAITADYGAMEDAKGRYASNLASMEYATQESTDNMVSTVAGAKGNMASAAGETAQAGADAAKSKTGEYNEAGKESVDQYASGMQGSAGEATGTAEGIASDTDSKMQLNNTYSYGQLIGISYASGMSSQSGNVRTVAVGLANTVKSAVNINLYSSGQTVGRSFASGLSSQYGNVVSAAKGIANAVSDYLHHSVPKKGPLHEDNKWGAELGHNIAAGIKQSIPEASSASNALAQSVYDGIEKTTGSEKEKVAKSIDEIESELISAAESRVNELKKANRISNIEIGQFWKAVANKCRNGSLAYSEAMQKVADTSDTIDSNIISSAKEALERQETYHSESIAQEVEYWDQIRKVLKEGTDARYEADKEYLSKKQELNNKLQSIEDNLTEAIKRNYESIRDSFGLFDDVSLDDVANVDLIGREKKQAAATQQYADALEELSKKKIPDDLMSKLMETSVDDVGYLQKLLSYSDDQLNDYIEAWEAKSQAAAKASLLATKDNQEAAVKSINELMGSSEKSIQAGTDIGTNVVNGIIKSFTTSQEKVIGAIDANFWKAAEEDSSEKATETVSNTTEIILPLINDSMEAVMTQAGTGIADNANTVTDEVQSVSDDSLSILNTAADYTYSYGAEFGINMASGIRSQIAAVRAAAEELAAAAAGPVHHSTPDYGPLKGDDKWGAEMVQTFASSMLSKTGDVKHAALAVAKAATFSAEETAQMNGNGGSSTVSYGDVNVSIYAAPGQSTDEIANAVANKIQRSIRRREAVG